MASKEGPNDMYNGSNNALSAPTLEGFITSQMSEQRATHGSDQGENIDQDKIDRFMSRALSESRRMTHEVEKSEAKMSKLHAELGKERLANWRQEHAAEVLTHQQAQSVELSQPKLP